MGSHNQNHKFRVIATLAAICLAMMLTGCAGLIFEGPVKSRAQVEAEIPTLERTIAKMMKCELVEAVSVAIVSGGAVTYSHTFGAAGDGRFQAASISKVVSSYAALKLVQEGKLHLDAPLSGYTRVPYFQPGSQGDRITLRMVLNHTSGLPNDALGRNRTVRGEPGQQFRYSGGGFAYLTSVVEDVAGQPFDTSLESEVLGPLGMGSSTFRIAEYGVHGVSAAFTLMTTADDLAKFFIELMEPRNIDPDLVAAMLSDSVRINDKYSWGLGIGIQHGGSQDAIWHWGNNGNRHRALVLFYPKTATGVVVMTRGLNGSRFLAKVAHWAIGGSQFGLDYAIPLD